MTDLLRRPGLRRRALLQGAGALTFAPALLRHATAADTPRFALGIASGQPRADGMVLWTRLTGAELGERVNVRWEVAEDERFTRIVASGEEPAEAAWAHSVHAEPTGLADELGMKLYYWHVMDSGKDSVDLLRRLLDRFGTGLAYVLVRNQVRGADFSGLEQSGEQARAIGMGAHVVSVKKLNEHVIQKIDSASSSFWQAKASDRDSTGLGLMDRQRVKMWLRDLYREIDDVGV